MGENAPYVKLHFSSLTDSRTGVLDRSLYGLWVKLLQLTKMEGNKGMLVIQRPIPAITTALLALENESELIKLSNALDNSMPVEITPSEITIRFPKWKRYQVDNSTPRVRKFRDKKRNGETNVKRYMKRTRDIESESLSLSSSKGIKEESEKPLRELTTAMREYATERGVLDIEEMCQACIDWHLKKGTKIKNWPATWRTWVRNAQEFTPHLFGEPEPAEEKDWREEYKDAIAAKKAREAAEKQKTLA